MSERLNESLCLPQGSLKSTTGVCCDVFLPSIQTSDQGIELIVIVQSPPPPPLSLATDLRGAGVSSDGASPAPSSPVCTSRFLRPLGEPPPAGDATAPPPAAAAGPLLPPPVFGPALGLRTVG